MTTAEQAARPADLFVIPTLRIEVDEQGKPVNAAQPILAKLPDGTVIAEVYTSPGRLVDARGEAQPWAAMRPRDLAPSSTARMPRPFWWTSGARTAIS
jgi:hypothetical protein